MSAFATPNPEIEPPLRYSGPTAEQRARKMLRRIVMTLARTGGVGTAVPSDGVFRRALVSFITSIIKPATDEHGYG
jgi:hypothetical protein